MAPQAIPAGDDETVPMPGPARVTVSEKVFKTNVAETVVAAFIVSEHVPVPADAHAPPQPANDQNSSGVAVSVTALPAANDAEQAVPQ